MSTDRELTPEDHDVLTLVEDFGRTRAEGTSPWPALDGAIRRDSRNRTIRRSAAGMVAASLLAAAVLPFTAIRVQPLHDLAASLGLRHSGTDQTLLPTPGPTTTPRPTVSPTFDGVLQDVTPNPKDYVEKEGAPLPAPGGRRITDAAWLSAASDRAMELVTTDPDPGRVPAGRTIWAADDGTTVRVIVGVVLTDAPDGPDDHPNQDPWIDPDDGSTREPTDWVVLTGAHGAPPADLLVASIGPVENKLSPVSEGSYGPDTELFALFDPTATAPKISRMPLIGPDGSVTSTWHAVSSVVPGWWLADLKDVEGTGYRFGNGGSGKVTFDQFWTEGGDMQGGELERYLNSTNLSELARDGYRTAHPHLTFDVRTEGRTLRAEADAEFVGVLTPGGGWLVMAELQVTKAPTAAQGGFPGLGPEGGFALLPTLAAPVTKTGGTPFVGFPLADPEHRFMRKVVVWAPPGVTAVRSGRAKAAVVDGGAVLDVWSGAERTATNTSHQSVLIEGLDGTGRVIARSRVHEAVAERFSGDEPNPHDGWPQTVIAWP